MSLSTLAALMLLVLLPVRGYGQDLSVFATGTVSEQLSDDTYVGPQGPYLDKPLAGTAIGINAGLSAVAANGVAVSVEFSTADLQVEQSGRLVGGRSTGELRDTLISGLIGARVRLASMSVTPLLGVTADVGGATRGNLTSDVGTFGVTGGVDFSPSSSAHVSFVATARYTYVFRPVSAAYAGIGPSIVRFGAGIRVRL
ncbi:MAG TPA: hypothetical protein VFA59_14760 [Vicinamibacterales bacterium]|nr:hypothetical protein [Vicinamibacterales bacterium]